MKRNAAIAAVIALTMATGQLAFAQGNSNHGDRGNRGDNDRRQDNRESKEDRKEDRREAKEFRHDNRDFGRSHNKWRAEGRGVGPGHEYYRGDRLPAEYRHRQYVVNDWRGHHLSAPPSGYQWVQSGNDYILVSIVSGIISQLLLGS
jgi:Ni/Co efflux regulator RcnB